MKNIHKRQIIELSIIVIALFIIFMLTSIVHAYNVFTASEISDQAAANDPAFWDNYQVDDRINDYSGADDKTQWICLADRRVTGVGGYNRIMSIIDINRDEKGKYSTSIYNQDGVSNQDNDFNAKKLAYLAYAATVDPGTGLIGSRLHGPRDAFYYFYTTTDLQYLIGNFSLKKNDGDAYLDTAASSGATVLAYADQYANSEVVGSSADITGGNDSNASVVVAQDPYGISYSYIGPFNMYAEGGTIIGVSIQDGYNWSSVVGFSNAIGGDIQGIWGIPMNGNNFYIVTNSTLTSLYPSVTINTQGTAGGGIITNPVTGEQTTGFIKARVIFIGSNRGQGTAVFRGDGEIITETTNDSITLSARNSLGKLTVQKEGTYTGIQSYENVNALGFKIYRLEGNTRRYMRINNVNEIRDQVTITLDGNTSYSESAENATTIFTSANGTVTLDNISVEHSYYIEEINSDATNYQTKIVSATVEYGYTGESNLYVDYNITGPINVQLKGENNVITKIKIKDYRKIGNLSIEKVDEDNFNTKLGNVEFKIRNKDTNRYVIANKISSSSYAITDPLNAYTTNEANGTTFVTNATTGKIVVNGLDVGNYEIIEKKNPNYGYTILANNVSVSISNGQTASITLKNRKQTGNMKIHKVDADNSQYALSGVSFKIKDSQGRYIIAVNTSGVTQSKVTGTIHLGSIQTTTDTNKATQFITDNSGNIRIYNLLVGTYSVSEVSIGDNYGYILAGANITWVSNLGNGSGNTAQIRVDKQVSNNTGTSAGQTDNLFNTLTIKNRKQTGNMKIHKTDADNNQYALPGVSFKIKDSQGRYIIAVDTSGATQTKVTGTIHLGNIQTTTDTNKATQFITDSSGNIRIYNLLVGTYSVSEVSIGDNFGYVVADANITWTSNLGNGSRNTAQIRVDRQTSNNTGTSAGQTDNLFNTLTMKNKREYIKINGYAWEDKTDGKGSNKDYEWKQGTEDKRLQNITVTLKKADGTVLDTAVTDANGAYIFGNYDTDSSAVKIKIDDLQGAYIEFEYNGMSYQSIPINSSFTLSNSKINGVKNSATDTSLRDNFNKNYATISKGQSQNISGQKTYNIKYTYSDYKSKVVYGDSVKYGYNGQSYPISGVYAQYEITATTNKNSGKALCTQYTANDIRKNCVEEIAGINLGLEEREMPDLNVSEQDLEKIEIQLNNYTHTYKYGQVSADPNGFAGGDVSNIAVRFASKYFNSSYTREIYTSDVVYNAQAGNEGKLKMYMTYKIELTNEATSLNSTVKTIANYYDDRYENISITDQNGKAIDYQIDNSYHVNGLKKMNINVNQTLGPQTSKTITVRYQLSNDAINALLNGNATLNSITEITSYSTYQNNSFSTPYAGIDVDSAPDTATPNNRDTYEDDTNWAPSLILTLKEGRIIEGTVWEDAPIEELLEGTGYDKHRMGDGQYQSAENIVNNVKVDLMTIDDSGNVALGKLYKKDNTVVDATTTTGGKGEYSFVGVIPGKYIIRYTYGDNSVICDTNGNVIKNVDADNYKSTIYRGGNKSAVNAMTDYWYRGETSHEGAIRLSDAKDNDEYVNERITEEEFNYATATESRDVTEIVADTRRFDIKLDYDINLDNISEYGADLKFVFDNIDFGIIERPRQSLLINKEISNIQITLSNGVTLMNGDPRSQNISGVKMLPNGNVSIEVDDEIIQGATLRITYKITVDNKNCEIDYNDEDYYIYGTVPADKENKYRITTIVDMFDYLPEELVLESTDGNWESIEITPDMKGVLLADDVYEVVKNLQNIIHLKNPIFENMKPGSEAVDTTMVVSKQLSVSSDDLSYENDIEVIKLKGRKTIDSVPGNYDPTTNTPNEPDDDSVELTITGPTGDDRQYILYGAIGIGILVVVGVGIVIIKRKVLRK